MKNSISAHWIADHSSSDWLANDPRSATAMLRGRSDGREKLYELFCEYHRDQNPKLSDEDLMAMYGAYTRNMRRANPGKAHTAYLGFFPDALLLLSIRFAFLKFRLKLWNQKTPLRKVLLGSLS